MRLYQKRKIQAAIGRGVGLMRVLNQHKISCEDADFYLDLEKGDVQKEVDKQEKNAKPKRAKPKAVKPTKLNDAKDLKKTGPASAAVESK